MPLKTSTLTNPKKAQYEVELFDDAQSVGKSTTDANGNWSFNVTKLALGTHRFKAVVLSGSGATSNIRTFTVESPVPGFVLDPSPVSLNGRVIRFGPDGPEPLSWPANTTHLRTPSGGVPPYSYSSSNRMIAAVNASGRVSSERNGHATITVRDSAGHSGSYEVTVSNAVWCQGLSMGNYSMAQQAAANAGLRIPSLAELQDIWRLYESRFTGGDAFYWSTTVANQLLKTHRVKNLYRGNESTLGVIYNANIVGIS